MSLSVDYDALEATTRIEDITDDRVNQDTLRSLRDDDDLSCLHICEDGTCEPGEYYPGSSEELGWLGHFAKKSTNLEEFCLDGGNFSNCSKESVGSFFEDIGKCNRIKKLLFHRTDLTDIICKLGPIMRSSNITYCAVEFCDLVVSGVNFLFNTFPDMKRLEALSIDSNHVDGDHGLDDDAMAGCIPSLATCTGMRTLNLRCLELSTSSCIALSTIFPRMASLRDLNLDGNAIGDDCVEVLVRGLVECTHLQTLNLEHNRIGDNGLEVLVEGLPLSVDALNLNENEVTLARILPLLRFKRLYLLDNALSRGSPRSIAASLANPECRLETLDLNRTNVGDEGAATLAEGLRNNQRLTTLSLLNNNITVNGWNEFSSILCDTGSINATHASNHALQDLGTNWTLPQHVKMLLKLNRGEDKSRVAATKILQTHRHLDMTPLLSMKMELLPHVVAWLDRFAESRLDLKLSSIFEFARAMPMDVVDGVAGKKKRKKRRRGSA